MSCLVGSSVDGERFKLEKKCDVTVTSEGRLPVCGFMRKRSKVREVRDRRRLNEGVDGEVCKRKAKEVFHLIWRHHQVRC